MKASKFSDAQKASIFKARRGRQRIDHQRRALNHRSSGFRREHDDGMPPTIADGMQLRVPAALGAPDTAGNRLFLKGWQRYDAPSGCVLSSIRRDGLPALRANSANILLKTPRRLQRTKRL